MNGPLDALLELHCAASAFRRRGGDGTPSERERLRRAVVALMQERGTVVPADLIGEPREALAALSTIIRRCLELRVDWTQVVAIVNRESLPEKRG